MCKFPAPPGRMAFRRVRNSCGPPRGIGDPVSTVVSRPYFASHSSCFESSMTVDKKYAIENVTLFRRMFLMSFLSSWDSRNKSLRALIGNRILTDELNAKGISGVVRESGRPNFFFFLDFLCPKNGCRRWIEADFVGGTRAYGISRACI